MSVDGEDQEELTSGMRLSPSYVKLVISDNSTV